MKCSYCGNTSGMRDSRGGCISCGGDLQSDSQSRLSSYAMMIKSGFMTAYETRQYTGITGSSKYQSIYDLPEVKDYPKDMIYPLYSNNHGYPVCNTLYGVDADIVLAWRNAGGEGIPPQWFIDAPVPPDWGD